MPVFKPRTRVVYFRISEDEFCQLNRLCEEKGARSLSDMARTAMRGLLNGADAPPQPAGEPGVVAHRLDVLERRLAEVTDTLRTLSVSGRPEEDGKENRSDQVV